MVILKEIIITVEYHFFTASCYIPYTIYIWYWWIYASRMRIWLD